MASNYFGQIFRITTFGESHGPAIGVVIDGCPAGLFLSKQDIESELFWRRAGKNSYVSPRTETDQIEILSGLFEGQTTGSPIAILIRNCDVKSESYEAIKNLYRPGHANFTYLEKYGIFDYRGGGRASARETAARVAAGAVAKKLLKEFQIECVAFLSQIGDTSIQTPDSSNLSALRDQIHQSPIFCPDPLLEPTLLNKITQIQEEKDSLGGIVACLATSIPNLGDPVYSKLEALLAFAMLSIPASKGFEIGQGFASARLKGSEHNDSFIQTDQGSIRPATNLAGGTLGGISTGEPLFFRVAFKPTSSIKKTQQTTDLQGNAAHFRLPETARHDPCVAIRAVPIVEAMTALVLVDALLMNRVSRLAHIHENVTGKIVS
ncbi:MAG: chorismate synthase, partial [Chlamydiae bacterium]|nr:chorismate synthase [Chlamydiota bacterium]